MHTGWTKATEGARMLIPLAALKAQTPSETWSSIFKATWVLSFVLAIAAFAAAPIDFFADAAQPGVPSISAEDRFTNLVLVILLQNVVLAFLLFATHVTSLLEAALPQASSPGPVSVPKAPKPPSPDAWTCRSCGTLNEPDSRGICRSCLREHRSV
jgi:hypothetical protein